METFLNNRIRGLRAGDIAASCERLLLEPEAVQELFAALWIPARAVISGIHCKRESELADLYFSVNFEGLIFTCKHAGAFKVPARPNLGSFEEYLVDYFFAQYIDDTKAGATWQYGIYNPQGERDWIGQLPCSEITRADLEVISVSVISGPQNELKFTVVYKGCAWMTLSVANALEPIVNALKNTKLAAKKPTLADQACARHSGKKHDWNGVTYVLIKLVWQPCLTTAVNLHPINEDHKELVRIHNLHVVVSSAATPYLAEHLELIATGDIFAFLETASVNIQCEGGKDVFAVWQQYNDALVARIAANVGGRLA